MPDTVHALVHDPEGLRQAEIRESISQMVADVAAYEEGVTRVDASLAGLGVDIALDLGRVGQLPSSAVR